MEKSSKSLNYTFCGLFQSAVSIYLYIKTSAMYKTIVVKRGEI